MSATKSTTERLCLDLAGVARMLSVSSGVIRRLVHTGGFPAPIAIGGAKRWRVEDVRQWVAYAAHEVSQ